MRGGRQSLQAAVAINSLPRSANLDGRQLALVDRMGPASAAIRRPMRNFSVDKPLPEDLLRPRSAEYQREALDRESSTAPVSRLPTGADFTIPRFC
jgi:hypothetical protein